VVRITCQRRVGLAWLWKFQPQSMPLPPPAPKQRAQDARAAAQPPPAATLVLPFRSDCCTSEFCLPEQIIAVHLQSEGAYESVAAEALVSRIKCMTDRASPGYRDRFTKQQWTGIHILNCASYKQRQRAPAMRC
jgi:hypothetical protein